MPRSPISLTRVLASASILLASMTSFGCASAPSGPPLAHTASRWEYLASRYDADGDGRIDAAEYGRGADAFERLDTNGDDAVTAADFEGSGATPRDALAQALLNRHFHDDGDAESLETAEVEATLTDFDDDGDGRLGRDELERLLAERPAGEPSTVLASLLADTTELDALLAVADDDDDGRLAHAELAAYHRDEFNGMLARMVEHGPPPGESEDHGPAAGEAAPDFELRPPDGGAAVTLSSFAGDRPVALVFGSYT